MVDDTLIAPATPEDAASISPPPTPGTPPALPPGFEPAGDPPPEHGVPVPAGFTPASPFDDLTPDQIFKEIEAGRLQQSELVQHAKQLQDSGKLFDGDNLDKLAEANRRAHTLGFRMKDLPSVGEGLTAAGKSLWNLGKMTLMMGGLPIRGAIDVVRGRTDPETEANARTVLAGVETAWEGNIGLAKKFAGKAGRTLGVLTPWAEMTKGEATEALLNQIDDARRMEAATQGKGTITGALFEGMDHVKVDPEEVQNLASGEPLTFVGFGQGFKLVGGFTKTVVGTAANRVAAVNAVAKYNEALHNSVAANIAKAAADRAAKVTEDLAAKAAKVVPVEGAEGAARKVFAVGPDGIAEATSQGANRAAGLAARGAAGAKLAATGAEAAEDVLKAAATDVAETTGARQLMAIDRGMRAVGRAAAPVVGKAVDAATSAVPRVFGVGVMGAGKAAEVGAGVLKMLSKTAPLVGAVTGAAKGGPVGALAGLAGAQASKAILEGVAQGAVKTAAKITMRGAQLAKGTPEVLGPYSRAVWDLGKALPSVAGRAAEGFVLNDLPMAVVTSEVPDDTRNMPLFGTAFGLAGGAAGAGRRMVVGQLLAPREWSPKAAAAANNRYGQSAVLDAANAESVAAGDPSQVARFGALRKLAESVGGKMYWVSDPVKLAEALKSTGVDPAQAQQWAQQGGMFLQQTLRGDDGKPFTAILVRDPGYAAHESKHLIQAALGEEANQVVDQAVFDEFAPVWDQLGNSYTRQFFKNDPKGWADRVSKGMSWRDILTEIATDGAPAPADGSAAPVFNADQYLAREIAAEHFDAIVRHSSPELLADNSLPGKLARIVAKLTSSLGADPYRGETSQNLDMPLSFSVAERVTEAAKGAIKEAAPKTVPGVTLPGGAPVTPRGAPVPGGAARGTITPEKAAEVAAGSGDSVFTRAVETIRNALAGGVRTFGVAYRSVVHGDTLGRTAERAAHEEAYVKEALGSMPEDVRRAVEKTHAHIKFENTARSGLQSVGNSLEVFFANADALAKELLRTKRADLSPYPIDTNTGHFTPEGWREMWDDFQADLHNLNGGWRGDGSAPLKSPGDYAGVSERALNLDLPPNAQIADPSWKPIPLTTKKADWFNMLYGKSVGPPNTLRASRKPAYPGAPVVPANIVARGVAEATALPTESNRVQLPVRPRSGEFKDFPGMGIMEMNPLRAEMERAGVKVDELRDVVQRINLANVEGVTPRPDVQFAATSTDARRAGFSPEAVDQKAPRREMERGPEGEAQKIDPIVSPAVRWSDGSIDRGAFHGLARSAGMNRGAPGTQRGGAASAGVDGFVTKSGKFLNREEALEHALNIQQLRDAADTISGAAGVLESGDFHSNRAFSPEDVLKNPAFRKWFGKSKTTYANGVPKVYYHGALADFTEFKPEFTSEGSDMGPGFYLTNSKADVNKNYASVTGADQQAKKDMALDQQDPEAFKTQAEADAAADAALGRTNQGVVMPVYARLENPVILAGDYVFRNPRVGEDFRRRIIANDRSTSWDFNIDEEGNESGSALELLDAARSVLTEQGTGAWTEFMRELEGPMSDGSITAGQVFDALKYNEYLDSYVGDTFNKIVRALGHDGIIDQTVPSKFGSMGVTRGTEHVIVFDPGQIKSAIGNSGKFSRANADIRFSPRNEPLKVVRINGEEEGIPKYRLLDKQGRERALFEYDAPTIRVTSISADGPERGALVDRLRGMADEVNSEVDFGNLDAGPSRRFSPPTEAEWAAKMAADAAVKKEKKRVPAVARGPAKLGESQYTIGPVKPDGASKAWVRPDGKVVWFDEPAHELHLQTEAENYAERFGIPVSKINTGAQDARDVALRYGFGRVNYKPASGLMTVEARAKDWPYIRPAIQKIVETQPGKIDRLRVNLMDERMKRTVDSDDSLMFRIPKEQRADAVPFPDLAEVRATPDVGERAVGATDLPGARPAAVEARDAAGIPSFYKGKHAFSPEANVDDLSRFGFFPHKSVSVSARALGQAGYDFVSSPEGRTRTIALYQRGKGEQGLEGEVSYSISPHSKDKAHLVMVMVPPTANKRPLGPEGPSTAELLYREMLATLQKQGVKELSGEVVSPAPIHLREKLLEKNRYEGFRRGDRATPLTAAEAQSGVTIPVERDANNNITPRKYLFVDARGEINTNRQFSPELFTANRDFSEALKKVRGGETFGATFNYDGTSWDRGDRKLDIVTLTSVDVPVKDLTPARVRKITLGWADVLELPDVVLGVYRKETPGPKGEPMASIDLNTAVEQRYRKNTEKFSADNNQEALWDSVNSVAVATGGNGKAKITDAAYLIEAASMLQEGSKVDVRKLSGRLNKRVEQGMLEGLSDVKEVENEGDYTRKELYAKHPELYEPWPRNRELDAAGIEDAPLYKQAKGDEAAAVKAYADRLVADAKKWADDPAYKLGLGWYERIAPLLNKFFGSDARMMAELLAATSPRNNPRVNFQLATYALWGFKEGRYSEQVRKYKDMLTQIDADNGEALLAEYRADAAAGKIDKPMAEPTVGAAIAWHMHKNNVRVRQPSEKLFGMHSDAVLAVLARDWMGKRGGPKVANFVLNLLGEGHEATIDVWASRTLRRLGYEGLVDRWRLQPKNEGGISDANFDFGQKVFRAAADQLGIEADALQAGAWFAEKMLWARNGWGRLNLGDYATEVGYMPHLRGRYEADLRETAERKKVQTLNLGKEVVKPRPE